RPRVFLRQCREDRPGADVIRASEACRVGFFRRIHRSADEEGPWCDAAGDLHGDIVIAEVDPVRAGGEGDIHTVIDEEQGTRSRSVSAKLTGELKHLPAASVLPAKLYGGSPGGECSRYG